MKPGHDLSGLIKFAGRDDWRPHLESAMGDHFGAAMEEFDLDFEAIGDVLGEHWAMTLWGCAFENLLTHVVESGGRNLVEDYLKRRGWKETATAVGFALAAAFILVWMNLAVSIIGTEDNPAKLMYGGVLPVLRPGT